MSTEVCIHGNVFDAVFVEQEDYYDHEFGRTYFTEIDDVELYGYYTKVRMDWITKYLPDALDLAVNAYESKNSSKRYDIFDNDAAPDVDPSNFVIGNDRRVVALREIAWNTLSLDFWVDLDPATNAIVGYQVYSSTGDESVMPKYDWNFVRKEFSDCDQFVASMVESYLKDSRLPESFKYYTIQEYGVNGTH